MHHENSLENNMKDVNSRGFFPPETLKTSNYDLKGDIWGLGILLY